MQVSLGGQDLPQKRTENETALKSSADETGRVISSPGPTKAYAKHSAKGKVKTSAMNSVEAEAVTIGLPYLKARETVRIENIGSKFSGNWRISRVRHEISSGGYICSLTLNRDNHGGKNGTSTTSPKKPSGSGSSSKSVSKAKSESKKPSKVIVDLR